MSVLYLYVCGLMVAPPPVKIGTLLQGGAKNSQGRGAKKFRLASLAISHPPDQNSETAPASFIKYAVTSLLSRVGKNVALTTSVIFSGLLGVFFLTFPPGA